MGREGKGVETAGSDGEAGERPKSRAFRLKSDHFSVNAPVSIPGSELDAAPLCRTNAKARASPLFSA